MKIRIDDIPQNISIKEIVLDIQVNDNSFKVQSTTFANSEIKILFKSNDTRFFTEF